MSEQAAAISLDRVLVPNPNFFLRKEGEEGGILFDANSGAVRLLNDSAATIWNLMDGQRSLAEVIEALRETFKGIDTTAENQVLKTAQQFYRYGAVGLAEEK